MKQESRSSWETIKRWFRKSPLTPEAEKVIDGAGGPKELLAGLDGLITRNELAVRGIHREIEALEAVERVEKDRIRGGDLPDRSRNNVLRRIQRLRTQMDGLEERLRIYNRNIQLQVQLIGRVQALDAMQLRGVDEETIEHILSSYEEQLDLYRDVLGLEEVSDHEIQSAWDDSAELAQLESEILGTDSSAGGPAREEFARDGSAVSSVSHSLDSVPVAGASELTSEDRAVAPRSGVETSAPALLVADEDEQERSAT